MINWTRPSPIQLNQPHIPGLFIISGLLCRQTSKWINVYPSSYWKQGVHYLVPAVFRTWASGAATKQVKCKSVFIPLFSFEGWCVCPRAELCRWILVKRLVDSKSFPRSSGVLSSLCADFQCRWYCLVNNVPLQRSMNFCSGLSGV